MLRIEYVDLRFNQSYRGYENCNRTGHNYARREPFMPTKNPYIGFYLASTSCIRTRCCICMKVHPHQATYGTDQQTTVSESLNHIYIDCYSHSQSHPEPIETSFCILQGTHPRRSSVYRNRNVSHRSKCFVRFRVGQCA